MAFLPFGTSNFGSLSTFLGSSQFQCEEILASTFPISQWVIIHIHALPHASAIALFASLNLSREHKKAHEKDIHTHIIKDTLP